LATLAALRQHLEPQQNDKQTDFLENLVPHINVPVEFNQDTLDLHMNIAIAYKENGMLGNVQSQPSHLKCHTSEVIVYVKNGEPYNKRQHVHNLLLAMMHCNCLETKMHKPRDDGIMGKWT